MTPATRYSLSLKQTSLRTHLACLCNQSTLIDIHIYLISMSKFCGLHLSVSRLHIWLIDSCGGLGKKKPPPNSVVASLKYFVQSWTESFYCDFPECGCAYELHVSSGQITEKNYDFLNAQNVLAVFKIAMIG